VNTTIPTLNQFLSINSIIAHLLLQRWLLASKSPAFALEMRILRLCIYSLAVWRRWLPPPAAARPLDHTMHSPHFCLGCRQRL